MSASAGATGGPSGSQEWRPSVNPWFIAGSVVLATFMEVLDTTIVAVSLPHMAGNLGATNEEATWVLTSYLVSNAIVLPASGWLALYFGRKRLLLACVALFTMSSFLCGMAPSMVWLILARILQGVGGGAMQPLSQAILLESFPKERRGAAMAAFGVGVIVAPVIGPTLGGWITDTYSWRWVFNINIPVGLLAFYLIGRTVEDPPYIKHARPGRIDSIGFGFLVLWIATLQIVLDKGQQEDWFGSLSIRWLSAISVAGLVAFIVRELRARDPVVNLKIFRNRNFWLGTAVITIFGAALYSTVTLVPLFLQTLVGYNSLKSGIASSPRGIGSLIAMPFVARLISKVDARWLLAAGVSVFMISTFMIGNLNAEIGMGNIVLPILLQGFGMGFIFVPLSTMTVATLDNRQIGNATGIYNLMRNLGGSMGISLVATYLQRGAQAHQVLMSAHLTPYDAAYQQRFAALKTSLTPYLGAPQAEQHAYATLEGIVTQQAYLRAFLDNFLWIAVFVALCIPGALLMKKLPRNRPAG